MVVGQATNNGKEAYRSNNGSEFDLVVGQAIRLGAQVPPEAHKIPSRLSRDAQVQQRHEREFY